MTEYWNTRNLDILFNCSFFKLLIWFCIVKDDGIFLQIVKIKPHLVGLRILDFENH